MRASHEAYVVMVSLRHGTRYTHKTTSLGALARTKQDETNRHVSWTGESSKAIKTEGFVFQHLEKKCVCIVHTYT